MKKQLQGVLLGSITLSILISPTQAAYAANVYKDEVKPFTERKSDYVAGKTFKDVPAGKWYSNTVEQAYKLGLITGKAPQSYDPNGDVTIAEVLTMAAKLHSYGVYGEYTQYTKTNPWYWGAVDWCQGHGIIKPNEFDGRYNDKARRDEVAHILANVFDERQYEVLNPKPTNSDITPRNTKYVDDINALYQAGIVSGSDKLGNFYPARNITRAEMSSIIMRIAVPSQRIDKGFPVAGNSAEVVHVDEIDRMMNQSSQSSTSTVTHAPVNIPSDYRVVIANRLNEQRAKEGLSPLELSVMLCNVSNMRADQLAVKYGHVLPDGSHYTDAFESFGANGNFAYENIAKNVANLDEAFYQLAGSSMAKTYSMSPNIKKMGVSYIPKGNESYWCIAFADTVENDNTFELDRPNTPNKPNKPEQERPSRPEQERPSRPEPERPGRVEQERPNVTPNVTPSRPERPNRPEPERPSVTPNVTPNRPNRPSETPNETEPEVQETHRLPGIPEQIKPGSTRPNPSDYADWFFNEYCEDSSIRRRGNYDPLPQNWEACSEEIINRLRAKEGSQPIRFNPILAKVSQIRAEELHTSFSHTRPNGGNVDDLKVEVGYRQPGEPLGGGAEACHLSSGRVSLPFTIYSWINSPGHYKVLAETNNNDDNIPAYGLAYYTSGGTTYWSFNWGSYS